MTKFRSLLITILLALGAASFAKPVFAYHPDTRAGVVAIKFEHRDTISRVCSDLHKRGLLPTGFSAARCISKVLARNFTGTRAESELRARYIRVGDVLFFPYKTLQDIESGARNGALKQAARERSGLILKLGEQNDEIGKLKTELAGVRTREILALAAGIAFGSFPLLVLMYLRTNPKKKTLKRNRRIARFAAQTR